MRLFERDIHQQQFAYLMDECLEERGQILSLEGVAAGGRTTLLRTMTEAAGRAGMTVMQATCSPREKELPGSALSQLLHSVPTTRELSEQRVPGHHEFCRTIFRLAAQNPLVIAVDDLHNVDPESLRRLLYLARRLGAARVLLLVTWQHEGSAPASFVRELTAEPHAHRLTVETLSRTGTAALLTEQLGGRVASAPLVSEIHRLSGGNLRLIEALVRDYSHSGSESDFVHEDGYGAAVVTLLERGGECFLRAARALALLGPLGTPDRVARLADLDPETGTVERVMATMTSTGVLRDGRFPHQASRTAVLATVTGSERTVLHRRAAKLLYSLGEPATAVASHLVHTRHNVETWAVPVLVEAAEQTLLDEGETQAESCLELAYSSCPQASQRAGVLDKLTEATWRRSPSAAARHLTPLLSAAQAGLLDGASQARLIRRLLWHGRPADATAVLDRLRNLAPSDPAVAEVVRHLGSWLAFSHPQLAQRVTQRQPVWPGPADRPADGDVRTYTCGDPWLATASALSTMLLSGRVREQLGRLEQTLCNLRPLGNDAWAEETAALALMGLLDLDMPDLVLEHCSALTTSEAEQAATWRAVLASLRAEAHLRRGHLTEAQRVARGALERLPAHGWGVAVALPLATLITAAVRKGDLEEARRSLVFSPPEAMFQSRYGVYYLHARGQYQLAAHHGYAALADFIACGDLLQALGLKAAALVPWRVGAAQAWLQLGNEDRARRVIREQLTHCEPGGGSGRGHALQMLAAVSPPERRPPLLLEAIDLFEQCGDQYAQARVLADLGYAYSDLSDTRRMRTTLRRARYLALSCAAAPLCEDLLAFHGQPEAPDEPEREGSHLTESERRVAHLAVLGYTNREIAQKLFVTSSTVEQHLTRVYRKLAVKSRRELPADLGTTALRRVPRQLQRTSPSRSVS